MQANNSKQKDNTVSKKAGLENKPKNWALYNMRVRKLESDMLLPGWLSAHRDQLRAQRSVTSMGKLYLYFTFTASTATLISGFNFQYAVSYWRLYSHSPKRTVSELWHENNRQTNGPQHCLMLTVTGGVHEKWLTWRGPWVPAGRSGSCCCGESACCRSAPPCQTPAPDSK